MRRPAEAAAALLLLALLAPVMAVAALGVWASDPGDVLYRAKRVGRGGGEFTMLKFRSMRTAVGPRITAGTDPRIFAWGRLLRATKVDELPQLLNILRGEMAFIGPRPEDPGVSAAIRDPRWRDVLALTPGLVSPGSLLIYRIERGAAHANPEAHYLSRVVRHRIGADLAYFRRRTLASDAAIILETARMIASRAAGGGGARTR